MKKVPKPTNGYELVQAFLEKRGEVRVGKTKAAKPELGLSDNVLSGKLTKAETAARGGKYWRL